MMKKGKITGILTTVVTIAALALGGCGSGASQAASSVSSDKASSAAVASDDSTAEASSTAAKPDPSYKVKLGLLTSHVLPVTAEANGYFKKYGVNVELTSFATGAPEVEAYTSGDLDIVETGDLPFLNGLSNGVDLKVVGTYSSSSIINGLVATKKSGITKLSDLKGKKVAVPFGTNIQPLLYEYLEKGGVNKDDVEINNLQNADAVNALKSGDVDAAVLWDPFLTQAASDPGNVQIADTKDIRNFVCPISTSSKFIKEHPAELQAVLQALSDAATWAKANPEKAAKLAADKFSSDNTDAFKQSIVKSDISVQLTDQKIKDLKLGASECYKYGLIEKKFNLDNYIDRSFSDKLNVADTAQSGAESIG